MARWKCEPLSPAQHEAVVRLDDQVSALGELLSFLLALTGQLRAGTIDRIMEKSDIELGLEYFMRGGADGGT
ncbi:MAG: hypothetical protein M3256_13970 [Actinomycetota bacterium]|nr:hypothetical protein [Actinomycetota bacterium]